MAKGKRKHSRQGIASKIANAALIAIGFSGAITSYLEGGIDRVIANATLGLVRPGQDPDLNPTNMLARALKFYIGPGGAATGLGLLKRHLLKMFPVRR